MKASFALAALIGVAAAGPNLRGMRNGGKLGDDPKFLQYCSKYNKNVTNASTFSRKQIRYHHNDNIIQENNRKAARSSDPDVLILGHNWTSDLEQEEYQQLLGLNQAAANAKKTTLEDDRRGRLGGRRLVDTATNVDHYADGYMVPIKDQGNCGSCWSFAALTALEGTRAKKKDQTPVRLSEQQVVDCTLTTNPENETRFGKDYRAYGCMGGWMTWAWDFVKDQGVMTNEDYPYFSGNTGSEGDCKHDASKTVGKVRSWGQIEDSVTDVKAKVMQQPLTVAVDAGSSTFQLYRSGVIKQSDGCGSQLNHAIVMVGYTDEDDGDNPSPNPDPSPGPSPDPNPEPEPQPLEDCDVTKWWHTCEPAVNNTRRHLADASGHNNYWKLENSWGVGWGDGGFLRIEISGGEGACGINSVIEWVEWDD